MNRVPLWTGAALLAFGLSVFAWKILILGLPVLPSDAEGLWRVDLEITVRGTNRRGSVRTTLPSSGPGQTVFDEHSTSDRLNFTIREENGERSGVWSGRLTGVHTIGYGFRVQLEPFTVPIPPATDGAPLKAPEEVRERYARPVTNLGPDAPEVEGLLAALRVPPSDDRAAQLRLLYRFVADEIATAETGSSDPVLTLATREGNPEGKVDLLCALLRAVGIPARPVLGLRLESAQPVEPVVWAEAWIGGEWIPMSPTEGFFAQRPSSLLRLRTDADTLLETSGVSAETHRYTALRERLSSAEITAMMLPANPILERLSLYRLPVATQSVLRLILLLPLGALAVSLLRNVIGVPTFGTFMPVLIAYTLRATALGLGLALVGAVIALGIVGRLLLERLRLLLVPRLSILLCMVVLAATGLALAGAEFENRGLTGGVLFPMVILTMLIERFSVTLAEEGLREALTRAAWSTVVAVVVYPVFRSPLAEHLMFGFPELVVVVMGLLVWIGGYTGYRVSDLLRFRSLARGVEDLT